MWLWEGLRRLSGTVTFRAEGGLCERFLNCLTREGMAVPLWNIVYEENAVTAVMRAADYPLVRPAARRTGTRVRLVSKSGAGFAFRPLFKRAGLWIGLTAVLVLYTALASRLWVIEVSGADAAQAAAVKACLAKNGVTVGARMSEVDIAAVQLRAIAQVENLHRLSLYFDGSIARVAVQWEEEGASVPDTTPANIVAAYDGRVIDARVTVGQSMVKVGEAVVAGDLLVCGAIETERGVLLRHATAEILAQTTHVLEETVPLVETLPAVGETVTQSTLRLLSLELPLYTRTPLEGKWSCETTERMLTLCGVSLPVGITSNRYEQETTCTVTHTREEVERLARERLDARIAQMLSACTVEQTVYEGVWEGDRYRLRATCSCTEDIARTVPLLISP